MVGKHFDTNNYRNKGHDEFKCAFKINLAVMDEQIMKHMKINYILTRQQAQRKLGRKR